MLLLELVLVVMLLQPQCADRPDKITRLRAALHSAPPRQVAGAAPACPTHDLAARVALAAPPPQRGPCEVMPSPPKKNGPELGISPPAFLLLRRTALKRQ